MFPQFFSVQTFCIALAALAYFFFTDHYSVVHVACGLGHLLLVVHRLQHRFTNVGCRVLELQSDPRRHLISFNPSHDFELFSFIPLLRPPLDLPPTFLQRSERLLFRMKFSTISSTLFSGLLFVIPIVAQTYSSCNPLTGGELGSDCCLSRKPLILF